MGANHLRGEVEFTAGGQTYILRVGTNELVEMETALGIPDPLEALRKGEVKGVKALRTLFRFALSRYHRDLTDEQVGDLVDELPGGFHRVGQLLAESLNARVRPDESGPKSGATES